VLTDLLFDERLKMNVAQVTPLRESLGDSLQLGLGLCLGFRLGLGVRVTFRVGVTVRVIASISSFPSLIPAYPA